MYRKLMLCRKQTEVSFLTCIAVIIYCEVQLVNGLNILCGVSCVLMYTAQWMTNAEPRVSCHVCWCILRSGNTAETRGSAFVIYEDIFDAKNACDHLSGFNVCNRYLVVLYYQPNKVHIIFANAVSVFASCLCTYNFYALVNVAVIEVVKG